MESVKLVEVDFSDGVARLTLSRPNRGNALIPDLLDALRAAIGKAAALEPRALVLTGAGRAFSSGGDIVEFLDYADDERSLRAYSDWLVGQLNAALLDLLAFPAPVIARVNGPATGGSVGFVLVADIVVMSTAAFLQPYYAEMGFSPDGGWTALLPERIGTARALELQYCNRRLGAEEARDLGLATSVVAPDRLDEAVAHYLAMLRDKDLESLRATRARVWDEARRGRVAAGLQQEKDHFLKLIAREEAGRRMRAFVRRGS